MSSNEPDKRDEALRKVLKEWRVDASLPPRFESEVWRRIERKQTSPVLSIWAVIAHSIGSTLARPALAAIYVSLFLVVGATAGWMQAHHNTERVREELGLRYVRVLDPYLAPRE